MRNGFVLLLFVVLHLLGAFLFMFGFFPPRIALQRHPQNDNTSKKPIRLVFMIIDAFAYEFLDGLQYANDMPLLRKSINQNGVILFRARVQSPTVTLPRIKALVSGTIPNYMDVVLNLAQPRFDEDNWLVRAKESGYEYESSISTIKGWI